MGSFAQISVFRNEFVLISIILNFLLSMSQGEQVVFFDRNNYEGNSFSLAVSGGCYNFKNSWLDRISSAKVAPDSCIVAWNSKNCLKQSIKLTAGSSESVNLKDASFDKKIRSVSLCTEISFKPMLEVGDRMWNPTRPIMGDKRKKDDSYQPEERKGSSIKKQGVELNFYDEPNFKGSILTLVSNGNCYNLKAKWADRISSVDSGGRCLVIWDRIDCEGRTATLSSSAEKDFENLERIGFDKRIRSVQLCTTPLAEVVNQEDEEKDSPEMEKDENESEEKNQRKSKDRSIEMPKSDSRSDDELRKVTLNEHNKLRRLHGVADFEWDFKLQNIAQAHAEWLAKRNKFEHSTDDDLGENIGGISVSDKLDAIKQAIKLWYAEIEHYNFNKPVKSVLEIKAGHFTQIVWKTTTHVGLGIAWNPKRKWYVIVANYAPPGNYKGAYEKNVFPPLSLLEE